MTHYSAEPFAAYVALCERKLVADRMEELRSQPESSWREREMGDLRDFLAEVDSMVSHHRAVAPSRAR
jgi:hypothetical protein